MQATYITTFRAGKASPIELLICSLGMTEFFAFDVVIFLRNVKSKKV